MDNEPNGGGPPLEPEQPDGKKDPQLPPDPSTSDQPDGKKGPQLPPDPSTSDQPGDKDDDAFQDKPNRELKKQTPEEERRERFQWVVASQFAYTLVGATLLLGWLGHWLGNKLGGEPWNLILMLLFGGSGFVLEMWRMLRMFSPKDDKKNKDKKGDDK